MSYLDQITNEWIDREGDFEPEFITAVYIDTAYGEFTVWVEEGSCLEYEMLEQYGLDADLIDYKVIKRVRIK